MHLHLFLLLLGFGVSSYSLPLKKMLPLPNKTEYTIIDEMLCLLKAEKQPIEMQFSEPLHVTKKHCAHNNTETFIHELKKMSNYSCMKTVEIKLEKLEKTCSILMKSSFNDEICSAYKRTNFSHFKESLEEFLKWVNGNKICNNTVRSESGLYLDSKCRCPDPWKYRKGLL